MKKLFVITAIAVEDLDAAIEARLDYHNAARVFLPTNAEQPAQGRIL